MTGRHPCDEILSIWSGVDGCIWLHAPFVFWLKLLRVKVLMW